ncbi:MAG TPA: histidine kinase [bacterium]|nr:histidine kinase [bacterium]
MGTSDESWEGLEGQIRPHFLFNALTTIQAYVRDQPGLAEELIGTLARYVQTVLTRHGPVSLGEELALVQLYLGLERARLGARLRTIFDVDPLALGLSVPALLVQPLVENAVVHAAARRAEGATLRLAVRYRPARDRLVVVVADDGPGIVRAPPAETDPPLHDAAGPAPMGVRNTRLRLHSVYGRGARLRLLRRCGGGTIAAFSIPAVAGGPRGAAAGVIRGGTFGAVRWSGR